MKKRILEQFRPFRFLLIFAISLFSNIALSQTSDSDWIQTKSILDQKSVQLSRSEENALKQILSANLKRPENGDIDETDLTSAVNNFLNRKRMTADQTKKAIVQLLRNPSVLAEEKSITAHLLLKPFIAEAGVCSYREGRNRCAFILSGEETDIQAQIVNSDGTAESIPALPADSELAYILDIPQDDRCSLFSLMRHSGDVAASTPRASDNLILKGLRSIADLLVGKAYAQVNAADYLGTGCIDSNVIGYTYYVDDYWSWGSGYSAWAEVSGAVQAKFLATNSDSIGAIMSFAYECGYDCLLSVLTNCVDEYLENEMSKSFFGEGIHEQELASCVGSRADAKTRTLRPRGSYMVHSASPDCHTVPVPKESSPLYNEVSDATFERTYYGQNVTVAIRTYDQEAPRRQTVAPMSPNMAPTPTDAALTQSPSFWHWAYDFYTIVSHRHNLMYSTLSSANSNRSCSKWLRHPVSGRSAYGDSFWLWRGQPSGTGKWELPEINWIMGYKSGHQPTVCSPNV